MISKPQDIVESIGSGMVQELECASMWPTGSRKKALKTCVEFNVLVLILIEFFTSQHASQVWRNVLVVMHDRSGNTDEPRI